MPTHVYNVLKFSYGWDRGQMIDSIAKKLKGGNSVIDFNKIIKKPIDCTRDSLNQIWGTDRNAYESSIRVKESWKLMYNFQTAYTFPEPVLIRIFELFDSVDIKYVAADEGGYFAFHIEKLAFMPVKIQKWDDSNDPSGAIRAAICEALNYDH